MHGRRIVTNSRRRLAFVAKENDNTEKVGEVGMIDREKAIKELHDARRYLEDKEWSDRGASPHIDAINNVLALLKEQEAKTQSADSGMCEICSFYERALPVKPHYNSRTNWYECGACHYSITSGMICRSELIPACKVGFCAKCGKAVKWDD